MNNKPEHTADISAELRDLSRSAKYCELQPTVFGKPIARYFGELADRLDAATASEAMRLKEALAYLEHVGETGDGRLHFSDMVRVGNAKAMLKIIIAHRETESTVHNCNCVPQTVHNMAAMRDALVRIEKTAQAARTCNANEDVLRDVYLEDIIKLCTTALAEPPRNCDVGTAEEQEARYLKLKKEHIKQITYRPHVGPSFFPESLWWAQMQYESEVRNEAVL